MTERPESRRAVRLRRALLLLLLYALVIFLAGGPITDPEQWIIEHRMIRFVDVFSSYGSGKRWGVYSGSFEVLVYGLYRSPGRLGLVLYTAAVIGNKQVRAGFASSP